MVAAITERLIAALGACLSIPVRRFRREFHFREGRHREPILRYRYRNGCTRENHSPRFSDFRLLRQAPRGSPCFGGTTSKSGNRTSPLDCLLGAEWGEPLERFANAVGADGAA